MPFWNRISTLLSTLFISTLSPLNKLSSSKMLVCFNFLSASKSFKICENVVRVSNSCILMRRRVTRRLSRIQAVRIWDYARDGRDWQDKGQRQKFLQMTFLLHCIERSVSLFQYVYTRGFRLSSCYPNSLPPQLFD